MAEMEETLAGAWAEVSSTGTETPNQYELTSTCELLLLIW